ncbi:hypothetical protein [Methanolobus sp.]|jgi:hypothetical protein|uniref:hypothetical protein n=1 Tax=Methanolobus sp. TaxID=1874737 RepID=UPI0025E4A9FC|nr:hypothetical protein [Methanolobus sp.]
MKKRIKVEIASFSRENAVSQKNGSGTFRYLLNNTDAWVDLILSKTALILATVIILAAVYGLAGSSSDLVKKDELEVIAIDLASNIDAAGSIHSITRDGVKTYSFDAYSGQLIDYDKMDISVSGEYVVCTFADNGHNISAARQLSYKTLPFSPIQLRILLNGQLGANGDRSHPVNSVFPYTDITEYLAITATEEFYLNTSKEVRIERASVFVTDGSEVNELEYVLVYQ